METWSHICPFKKEKLFASLLLSCFFPFVFFRELQLGGTVCIETKSKNGKRLMRRVRIVNKAEHLQPYLKRVCEVLGCCSELVSATRYPLGYCNQTCCLKGQENALFGRLNLIMNFIIICQHCLWTVNGLNPGVIS